MSESPPPATPKQVQCILRICKVRHVNLPAALISNTLTKNEAWEWIHRHTEYNHGAYK